MRHSSLDHLFLPTHYDNQAASITLQHMNKGERQQYHILEE